MARIGGTSINVQVLWPLEIAAIKKGLPENRKPFMQLEPAIGVEPSTSSLQVRKSLKSAIINNNLQ
jgi:hypothetical protein